MNIKRFIGIGAAVTAGAVVGAAIMDKCRHDKNQKIINRIIGLVGDVIEYDDGVLELAENEHKQCTEISKKYDQLCKEYDELQNEYNEMLDYYSED